MPPVVNNQAAFLSFFPANADFVKSRSRLAVYPVARDWLVAVRFRKQEFLPAVFDEGYKLVVQDRGNGNIP